MTLETTQSLRILQIIGLSLSFFSASFGWSNCDPEKVKKIESLATRITQPQYFYRWGEGKYERQRMEKGFTSPKARAKHLNTHIPLIQKL